MRLEKVEDRALLAAMLAYHNVAYPFDADASGIVDSTDVFLVDSEIKANGERVLTDPNGPVNHFWDVNGSGSLEYDDGEQILWHLLGEIDEPVPYEPSDGGDSLSSSSDSLDGGSLSTMSSSYTITLDPVGSVNEGAPVTVYGSVSPPATYSFSGQVNWGASPAFSGGSGSITTDSNGRFKFAGMYYDDGPSPGNGTLSDGDTITLTATIYGQPVSPASTSVTIQNVSPVPELTLVNVPDPAGGPWWQVEGTMRDAGLYDKHTITIDWGDGSPPAVVSGVNTNQVMEPQKHRYRPWEIHHETDRPYKLTITVEDDDTGKHVSEPLAPMYLFDFDNDANNNRMIDAADDPLEASPPARYVTVNADDDNMNVVSDLNETAISGENDLAELLIGWDPHDGFDYTGWHLNLNVIRPITYADGTIWDEANKSGTAVPIQSTGTDGLVADWILDDQKFFVSKFLEATATSPSGVPSEIWMSLSLRTPGPGLGGQVVETDTIVFTVKPPEYKVNIMIADGQSGKFVPDADEDITGAVTVANKNDTDADGAAKEGDKNGTPDFEDDVVKETRTGSEAAGRDEVDLMEFIVWRPDPYPFPAAPVTLTITPGDKVRLWWKSTKEDPVDSYDPVTGVGTVKFSDDGNDYFRRMYVELRDKSTTVGDVSITATFNDAVDTVIATGVWATVEREQFDPPTNWANVPATPWKDEMDESLQKEVRDRFDGTGTRPVVTGGVEDHVNNVMLMEFTITPIDVTSKLPRVKFDITRRIEGRLWNTTDGNPTPQKVDSASKDFPNQWEESNDDSHDHDESPSPNSNGHMYVIDAPGIHVRSPAPPYNKWWVERTFYEFLRVSFGDPPEGNGLKGSQASPKIDWHSLVTIEWDAFNDQWARAGGPNEIKRGYFEVDDVPP